MNGTLYSVCSRPVVTAFAHAPTKHKNVVLWIPGLFGALGDVAYVNRVAHEIDYIGWSVVEANLSSAGVGWGGVMIDQDAEEIGQIITFLRKKQGKKMIVIMGHSTGCQDVIAYNHLLAKDTCSLPAIDGSILQAPVSDREFLQADPNPETPAPPEGLTPPEGESASEALVPTKYSKLWGLSTGITYQRWNSLTVKPNSDEINLQESEDFFSSDLSDARLKNVFGCVKVPLLCLLSGQDSSYPKTVNLDSLVTKFQAASRPTEWSKFSGIIQGADHAVTGETQTQDLVNRVKLFLQNL